MYPTTRITFNTDRSRIVEARIHDLVMKLHRFHDRILTCHVIVDGPAAVPGPRVYAVAFEIVVPGGLVCASSSYHPRAAHSDVLVALENAFENAKRQLDSFAAAD